MYDKSGVRKVQSFDLANKTKIIWFNSGDLRATHASSVSAEHPSPSIMFASAPTIQCITAQLKDVRALLFKVCIFVALILTDLMLIPSAQICFSLQHITQYFSAFCNLETPKGIFQGGCRIL